MTNDDHAEFTEADALALFARHLDDLGWHYHQSPSHPMIYSAFNGREAHWDFNMTAHAHDGGLFILSVSSFIPSKVRMALRKERAAAAEILSRLNWDLMLGCFEMNHADGEIRFRTSVALPGADITPGIIGHLIHSNLCIVDDRIGRILAVLHGGKSPAAVMKPKPAKTVKAKAKSKPRFELN